MGDSDNDVYLKVTTLDSGDNDIASGGYEVNTALTGIYLTLSDLPNYTDGSGNKYFITNSDVFELENLNYSVDQAGKDYVSATINIGNSYIGVTDPEIFNIDDVFTFKGSKFGGLDGVCSNSLYTDKYNCENNNYVWTGNNDLELKIRKYQNNTSSTCYFHTSSSEPHISNKCEYDVYGTISDEQLINTSNNYKINESNQFVTHHVKLFYYQVIYLTIY